MRRGDDGGEAARTQLQGDVHSLKTRTRLREEWTWELARAVNTHSRDNTINNHPQQSRAVMGKWSLDCLSPVIASVAIANHLS